MAMKEDAGFIEQHVEKIVLGIAAAFLIFAGVYWGLSSPREVDLKVKAPIRMSQKTFKPGEVDKTLKEMAEKLDSRMKTVVVKQERVENYRDRLKGIFNNPDKVLREYNNDVRPQIAGKEIESSSWGQGRKSLKPEKVKKADHKPIRLADLFPLPKPERPLVLINSEVQLVPRPGTGPAVQPVRAVRPAPIRRERERTEGRRPSEVHEYRRTEGRTEGRRPSEVREHRRTEGRTEGRRPSEVREHRRTEGRTEGRRPSEVREYRRTEGRTEGRTERRTRPRVARDREGRTGPRRDGVAALSANFECKEVDVIHGVAVLEINTIRDGWKKAMEKTYAPARLVFLAVEVQRRHCLPNGTWSEPENISPFVLPGTAPLPIIPKPDGKNFQEVRKKAAELAWIENKEKILEPPYYNIIWPNRRPGTWQIVGHKAPTRVCDLLPKPEVEPKTGTDERLPGESDRRLEEERRRKTIEQEKKRRLAEKERIRRANEKRRLEEERKRSSRLSERRPERRTERSPERRSERRSERRPERHKGRTEGPRRPSGIDRDRRPVPGRTPRADRPAPAVLEAPALVSIPLLEKQLSNPAGIVEVWFHDTNLEEGMTYSYRLRVVLVNPLLGWSSDVIDKDEAKVIALKTPWSDWSGQVDVRRPTEFFVVGYAKQMKTVEIEVFTQQWGQRIKHRFKIHKGEPIGGDVAKELVQLDSGEVQSKVVSFKTGAIAVDFDFGKKVRVKGMNYSPSTMELLYLDAQGKLCTRTEIEDMKSPRYNKLRLEAGQSSLGGAGEEDRP